MSAPVSLSSNDIDSIIDEVLSMPDNREFAGVILVADRKTGITIHRTVGLADESWGNKHTLDAKFLVGSSTKAFTAALVLKLMEEGATSKKGKPLRSDGCISDYLDYYREDNGDRITIHQLLSMRAGVPNYTAMGPAFFTTFSKWPFETRKFVEMFCSGDVLFEPGSRFQYSNSNYYILGAIIEELTGKRFGDAVEEKILAPLGMNDSGFFDPTVIYSRMTVGYNKYVNTRCSYTDMSVPFSAGGMYSTVPDFLKMDDAFHAKTILSDKSLKEMLTPWSFHPDFYPHHGFMYCGYGWLIQYMNNGGDALDAPPEPGAPFPPGWTRLVSSMGVLPDGFNTSIVRNPGAGRTVIVFSNRYCDHSDTFNVSNEITKRLLRRERS